MEPRTCHLALGSNVGDRATNIEAAIRSLDETPGVRVVAESAIIETEAVVLPGGDPQRAYFNSACAIETTLEPRALLGALQAIEQGLGRDRRDGERWAPRTIDIDIVLDGAAVIDEPGLTVPHPRMHERRFVLEPLESIAPDVVHPVLGQTVRAILEGLEGQDEQDGQVGRPPRAVLVLLLALLSAVCAPAPRAAAQAPEPMAELAPELEQKQEHAGTPPAVLDPGEVYQVMAATHRAGPIADRVTVTAISRFSQRDDEAIVRVDAQRGIAMFELGVLTALVRDGDLRITHRNRGDRYAQYRGAGRSLWELMGDALPPLPMPHIALAFEDPGALEHLTPFTREIAWTAAFQTENGLIALVGMGDELTVSYLVDAETYRLHTGIIVVQETGLRLEMRFEAIDPGDPTLWSLNLQGKSPVASLAQLQPGGIDIVPGAPAPPMVFFTIASEPWQLETDQEGPIALLLFRDVSPALLSARDALTGSLGQDERGIAMQPALITDRLVGIDLFERIGQTVHAYGEPVVWSASPEATIDRFTEAPACIVLIDTERTIRAILPIESGETQVELTLRINEAIGALPPAP